MFYFFWLCSIGSFGHAESTLALQRELLNQARMSQILPFDSRELVSAAVRELKDKDWSPARGKVAFDLFGVGLAKEDWDDLSREQAATAIVRAEVLALIATETGSGDNLPADSDRRVTRLQASEVRTLSLLMGCVLGSACAERIKAHLTQIARQTPSLFTTVKDGGLDTHGISLFPMVRRNAEILAHLTFEAAAARARGDANAAAELVLAALRMIIRTHILIASNGGRADTPGDSSIAAIAARVFGGSGRGAIAFKARRAFWMRTSRHIRALESWRSFVFTRYPGARWNSLLSVDRSHALVILRGDNDTPEALVRFLGSRWGREPRSKCETFLAKQIERGANRDG